MDNNENDYMTNFHNFNQSTSPQSKRNTKNLSLKLGPSNQQSIGNDFRPKVQSPIPFPTIKQDHSLSSSGTASISGSPILSSSNPPAPPRLFRHPSLSLSKGNNNAIESNSTLRRRTTLSLSIPTEPELNSKTSAKLSSNSIPSISSSSPITSSPIVPSTPLEFANLPNPSSKRSSSTTSSNQTIHNDNGGFNNNNNILRTQTLIQNLSNIDLSGEGDTNKVNAYPNGPACVLEPNLYLYSEPTAQELESFDLIINVAKELKPPIPDNIFPKDRVTNVKIRNGEGNYFFVPWTHTSKLCSDLPMLTDLIIDALANAKKVLIHCQCGVSRSASLIVALFMKLKNLNLNDAYNMLKEKAPDISPNMSLIFQLMEWGEIIGVSSTSGYNDNLCDSPISLQSKENASNGEIKIHHNTNDPLMTFQ